MTVSLKYTAILGKEREVVTRSPEIRGLALPVCHHAGGKPALFRGNACARIYVIY